MIMSIISHSKEKLISKVLVWDVGVATSSFWARDVFDLDSEAWKVWSGSFDKEELSLAMWWSLEVNKESVRTQEVKLGC